MKKSDDGGLDELEEFLFAAASLAMRSAIWAVCALTVAANLTFWDDNSATRSRRSLMIVASLPMTAIVQVATQVKSEIS